MAYRALQQFSSTHHGNVGVNDIIEVDEALAAQWIAARMIEPVVGNASSNDTATSSSSQVAQALNHGSAGTYETKPLPSRPTQASVRSPRPASATDVTPSGGSDTTKTSKKPATKRGRKIKAPR